MGCLFKTLHILAWTDNTTLVEIELGEVSGEELHSFGIPGRKTAVSPSCPPSPQHKGISFGLQNSCSLQLSTNSLAELAQSQHAWVLQFWWLANRKQLYTLLMKGLWNRKKQSHSGISPMNTRCVPWCYPVSALCFSTIVQDLNGCQLMRGGPVVKVDMFVAK